MDNTSVSVSIEYGLFGRTVLKATPPENGVIDWPYIQKVMDNINAQHMENSRQHQYLHNFYTGMQPSLSRQKQVRPEINNKIVENRANEVVEFKKGYEFSHPLQYTNAGESDKSEAISWLNKWAKLDDQETKHLDIAEDAYCGGCGYRITLPNPNDGEDEAPYYTSVLDPSGTFVVYSSDIAEKKLFAGKWVEENTPQGSAMKTQYRYGVYSDDQYWEFVLQGRFASFADIERPEIERRHALGMIPITEYPLNKSRLGYIELLMQLFNAINAIGSNRVDAIEQLVQAYLLFKNCELDQDEDGNPIIPQSGGAIVVGNTGQGDPDVKFVYAVLDQSHTQIAKEDLLAAIYEIAGMPDRNSRNGGGDTGQAVVLRNGWGAAEARAKSTEKYFRRAENEHLKLVLRICRDTASAAEKIGDLVLSDIDTKFTRNRSDNMQTKAQTLQSLLASGIHPEDAIEWCELFSDPSAIYLNMQKWLEEQEEKEKAEELAREEREAQRMREQEEAGIETKQVTEDINVDSDDNE